MRDRRAGLSRELTNGSSYLIHLQHHIAIVVDDLHGDSAAFGAVESPAARAVEFGPGGFVHLGPQGALELVVGFVSENL